MQVENKVNFVFEDQMIKLTQGKKKKEKPEVSNYAHGQTLTTGFSNKKIISNTIITFLDYYNNICCRQSYRKNRLCNEDLNTQLLRITL